MQSELGFDREMALTKELEERKGTLYKITLSFVGIDPRVSVRQTDELTDSEFKKFPILSICWIRVPRSAPGLEKSCRPFQKTR